MERIVNLSQLTSLSKISSEFSALSDDYIFTRITESNQIPLLTTNPVRIDGMAWLLCFSGKIDVEVNLSSFSLVANTISVIMPGSIVEIKDVDWKNLDCYILFVSPEFMRDINYDLNVFASVPVNGSHREKKVMQISDEEMRLLKNYYEILHQNSSYNPDKLYAKSIARCIIAALTYQMVQMLMTRTKSDEPDYRRSRRSGYVNEFMNLVRANYKRERMVSFYAEKLFISPKYLSLIIKETMGRSAAEVIDEYVILEAKNLLRFSGKNIQQVAYELNFPNQSSFGKYFKHLTGMSPSEFQRS